MVFIVKNTRELVVADFKGREPSSQVVTLVVKLLQGLTVFEG